MQTQFLAGLIVDTIVHETVQQRIEALLNFYAKLNESDGQRSRERWERERESVEDDADELEYWIDDLTDLIQDYLPPDHGLVFNEPNQGDIEVREMPRKRVTLSVEYDVVEQLGPTGTTEKLIEQLVEVLTSQYEAVLDSFGEDDARYDERAWITDGRVTSHEINPLNNVQGFTPDPAAEALDAARTAHRKLGEALNDIANAPSLPTEVSPLDRYLKGVN